MFKYEFWWQLANRIRVFFGRSPQRRRCCWKEENLGPVVQDASDLTYRRCQVCQSRHFTLTADPGKIGLHGVQVGCARETARNGGFRGGSDAGERRKAGKPRCSAPAGAEARV